MESTYHIVHEFDLTNIPITYILIKICSSKLKIEWHKEHSTQLSENSTHCSNHDDKMMQTNTTLTILPILMT